jgi:tetratricopeptide (TPR) repeat protein
MWPLLAALVRLHRFEEAEKWFQIQEKEQTGYGFTQAIMESERGRMRLYQNRLEEAGKILLEALAINGPQSPINVQTYALIGETKYRQGKLLEAEEFYKKAISGGIDGNFAVDILDAYNGIAKIYFNKGNVGTAKEALFTNLPFILGLFSAFNFLTSYLIFFENNLVLLFSLYLETLASLPPSTITG